MISLLLAAVQALKCVDRMNITALPSPGRVPSYFNCEHKTPHSYFVSPPNLLLDQLGTDAHASGPQQIKKNVTFFVLERQCGPKQTTEYCLRTNINSKVGIPRSKEVGFNLFLETNCGDEWSKFTIVRSTISAYNYRMLICQFISGRRMCLYRLNDKLFMAPSGGGDQRDARFAVWFQFVESAVVKDRTQFQVDVNGQKYVMAQGKTGKMVAKKNHFDHVAYWDVKSGTAFRMIER